MAKKIKVKLTDEELRMLDAAMRLREEAHEENEEFDEAKKWTKLKMKLIAIHAGDI